MDLNLDGGSRCLRTAIVELSWTKLKTNRTLNVTSHMWIIWQKYTLSRSLTSKCPKMMMSCLSSSKWNHTSRSLWHEAQQLNENDTRRTLRRRDDINNWLIGDALHRNLLIKWNRRNVWPLATDLIKSPEETILRNGHLFHRLVWVTRTGEMAKVKYSFSSTDLRNKIRE